MAGLDAVVDNLIPDPMPDPLQAARQRRQVSRDETRQKLIGAREKLLGRVNKPDQSAKWFALAEGMLAPTTTGSFGESMGRTAGAMGRERQQRLEAMRANEREMLGIDKSMSSLDSEELDIEMQLAAMQQRQGIATDKAAALAAKDTDKGNQVQSSKILDDSTVVTVMKDGTTNVINSEGIELEGPARTKAIKDAQQYGADVQGLRAGERGRMTSANKQADKAFDAIDSIRANIFNIDDAITAIDEGAITGVISSLIPSFRESSIKLDNMQKRMGLDVVGAVTFGALSKGELDLAQAVAIPKTLQPQDLKVWLQDRKKAQVKLMDYLTNQAVFLSTRGNTKAGWLEQERAAANERFGAPVIDTQEAYDALESGAEYMEDGQRMRKP